MKNRHIKTLIFDWAAGESDDDTLELASKNWPKTPRRRCYFNGRTKKPRKSG